MTMSKGKAFSLICGLLLPCNSLIMAQGQPCDLTCENGGRCEFVADKDSELAKLVQSGQLIQQCSCPDGYVGIACELELRQCNPHTKKCYNGKPCMGTDSGELSCDCAEADKVSRFAGMMCRNPYTEYCGEEYDPEDKTPFCTNGGKCKNSLIGAQLAPGNTSVNQAFRHLGCICPAEFYGPHCEVLNYDRDKVYPPDNFDADGSGNDRSSNGNASTITKSDNGNFLEDNLLFLGIGAAFAISFLCLSCMWVYLKCRPKHHHVDTMEGPDPPAVIMKESKKKRKEDAHIDSLVGGGSVTSSVCSSVGRSTNSSRRSNYRDSVSHRRDRDLNEVSPRSPYICDDDDDDVDSYDYGYSGGDGIYHDRHSPYTDSLDYTYDQARRDNDGDLYSGASEARDTWRRHSPRSSREDARGGLEPWDGRRRNDGDYTGRDLYFS